jgi:chlorobactene glucosyltransferase
MDAQFVGVEVLADRTLASINREALLGALALLAAQVAAGWLARRNYRRLPALGESPSRGAGHVSIVIPARDEADRLPALLHSLTALRYPDREVIVVDDASSDGTADVAERLEVRVIRVAGPEPGWTGKCFACWTGAISTRGDWLLFTDADTVHEPESLGLALSLAQDRHAGLCSLLANQRFGSFWERLLLPYAYFLYFVGAVAMNEPGGVPVANGQYMLFRRSDYDRLGGHAAVRDSIIEDVALARLAAEAGVRVVLARGERHIEVRMYRGLSQLWEGLGKNAFRFVRASSLAGGLTVAASIAFGSALPAALRAPSQSLRAGLLLVPSLALAGWARAFGSGTIPALLHPLAAAGFLALALDSVRRAATRSGTVWKGRRY